MTPPVLAAEDIGVGYDGRLVVDGLDLVVPDGVTAVVGPNACGKSTLLKALAGLLPLSHGRVTLDGRDVRSLPRRELARTVGVLPQHATAPDGIRVAELVARGRYPHRGPFGRRSSDDDAAVAHALAATATEELADRRVAELSGGQRQRVGIARALVGGRRVLLADEPTGALDSANSRALFELFSELAGSGSGVLVVSHDPECRLAADRTIEMVDGLIASPIEVGQ